MSKIKCAIIGMGVGEKHLEAIKKSKIAEIVAICDFKESKIKYLNLHSQKTVSGTKPISINKTKDGKLLLTSPNVCYMLMPLYLDDTITASNLHELWSGATGTETNLLLAAKSKKDLTKLLDSAIANSIYDVYNEMQGIRTSN